MEYFIRMSTIVLLILLVLKSVYVGFDAIKNKEKYRNDQFYHFRGMFLSIGINVFILGWISFYFCTKYIVNSDYLKGFFFLIFPICIFMFSYIFLWLFIREKKIKEISE